MSIDSNLGTLHLLSGQRALLAAPALLLTVGEHDTVILMQHAVWLALASSPDAFVGLRVANTPRILVLAADLEIRGLAGRVLHPGIERIDDDAWVAASESHPRCITWDAG